MLDSASKVFFHLLAQSGVLKKLASRYGMRRPASFARRFIAGETTAEAIDAARAVEARGTMLTLDYLGESLSSLAQAENATREYLEIIDAVVAAGIGRNISLKLTQLGLDVGVEYTTRLTFWGVSAHVEAEVLEFKPPERSRIRLTGPLIEAMVTTSVVAIDENRSRIEHDIEYRFRGGPLGLIAARALQASGGPAYVLRRGTLAQKRQVEEG